MQRRYHIMDLIMMTNKSSPTSSPSPTRTIPEQGLLYGSTEGSHVSQQEKQTVSKRIPYRRNLERDLGQDKAKRTILISGPTDSFLRDMVEAWDISYGEVVDRIVTAWRSANNA